jgi:hypothetical protein
MLLKNRSLADSNLLLRLSRVLALLFMLTLPHPVTSAMTETPAMTMNHATDAQGQMNHYSGAHEGMNGALCAMLCASLAVAEGPVHSARFADYVLARWTLDAGAVWVSFQPDPVQRPPDPTPIA